MMPGFDDHDWRRLDVPHDWSNEGPFSPQYGSSNGFAPGGIGWYRLVSETFFARAGSAEPAGDGRV